MTLEVLFDVVKEYWCVADVTADGDRAVAELVGYYLTVDKALEHAEPVSEMRDTKTIFCSWSDDLREYIKAPRGEYLPVVEGLETEGQRKWWFAHLYSGKIDPAYLEKLKAKKAALVGNQAPKHVVQPKVKAAPPSKADYEKAQADLKEKGGIVPGKTMYQDFQDKGGDPKKWYQYQKESIVKDVNGKVVGFAPVDDKFKTEEAKDVQIIQGPLGSAKGVYVKSTGVYHENSADGMSVTQHQLIPYNDDKSISLKNIENTDSYKQYIEQGGKAGASAFHSWQNANLIKDNNGNPLGVKPPTGIFTQTFHDDVNSGKILTSGPFGPSTMMYKKLGGDPDKYNSWEKDPENQIKNSSGGIIGYKAPSGDYLKQTEPEPPKVPEVKPDIPHDPTKESGADLFKKFKDAGGYGGKYQDWKSANVIKDSEGNIIGYKPPTGNQLADPSKGPQPKEPFTPGPHNLTDTGLIKHDPDLNNWKVPNQNTNTYQQYIAMGGSPKQFDTWMNSKSVKDDSGNIIGFKPPKFENSVANDELMNKYTKMGGDPDQYKAWRANQGGYDNLEKLSKGDLPLTNIPVKGTIPDLYYNKAAATKLANALGAQAVPKMTEAEQKSASSYTGSLYDTVNGGLRGAKGDESKLSQYAQNHIKNLDSLIDKSDIQKPVTVYRGVGYTPDDLKIGSIYHDYGYMSFSTNPEVSAHFGGPNTLLYRVTLNPGDKAIGLKAVSGIGSENEVLGQRNGTLKVTGISTVKVNGHVRTMVDVTPVH